MKHGTIAERCCPPSRGGVSETANLISRQIARTSKTAPLGAVRLLTNASPHSASSSGLTRGSRPPGRACHKSSQIQRLNPPGCSDQDEGPTTYDSQSLGFDCSLTTAFSAVQLSRNSMSAYQPLRNGIGSTAVVLSRTSKWTMGRCALPLMPEVAMVWPRWTLSPRLTFSSSA